jgi:hypothetical protein
MKNRCYFYYSPVENMLCALYIVFSKSSFSEATLAVAIDDSKELSDMKNGKPH